MVKTILGQTFIFILGFVAIMTLFGFINKYIFLPYLSDYDLTLTGVLIIYASVFFFYCCVDARNVFDGGEAGKSNFLWRGIFHHYFGNFNQF